MDEMPLIERPQSANEYGFGFRSSVTPIEDPESPPPPRPDGKRLPTGLLRGRNATSGPILLSEMSFTDPRQSTHPLIPTISVDSLGDDDDQLSFPQKSFHRSMLSTYSQGPCSDYSSLEATDRMQFVSSRIHQLVTAFTHRALNIKERIAQPPTPSTDGSERGDEGAPEPPPLSSRGSLDAGAEEVVIKEKVTWQKLRQALAFPKAIDPQGWSYIVWLIVVSFCFNYNAWGIPMRATFPYQTDANVATWLAADYFCDFIYVIDTLLVLPRLKFLRDGFWIADPQEMRRNYLQQNNFKIDVFSLMPLDLLYLYFGVNTPLLRLPRVLKIAAFWELFDRLDVLLASPFLVRVSRTFLYMLYLIHLDACVYYYFSLLEGGIGSTPFVYGGKGNAYLRCFYFGMKTVTKIGKNPKPVNDTENLFMIFNWLIGVFACAALIGQLHDIMAAAEQHETEYREKLDKTVNFMNRLNLPRGIQDKVRLWFTFSWSQQKTLDENGALSKLPRKLQAEIALNVHMQTLSKVQLFQDCDNALLRDLVLKLKPVLFLPGDLVCKKGEVGKEMYIVKTGQVQVMGGPKNEIVLVTLSESSVFGEISLLAIGGGNRRLADVRSKGFSNLFVLSKADLNEAIKDYPEAQKILQRKAKKLIKQNAARNKSLTNDDNQLPIINNRSETPRLLKTVLQTVDPRSKTAHLLLYGSRVSLHPRDLEHSSTPLLTGQNALDPVNAVIVPSFWSDQYNQTISNSESQDDEMTIQVEVNQGPENDCTALASSPMEEMLEMSDLSARSFGSVQRQTHVSSSHDSLDSVATFEILEEEFQCTPVTSRSWLGAAMEDLDQAFTDLVDGDEESSSNPNPHKPDELLLNPRSFQSSSSEVLRRNYFKPLFNSKVAPLPP